MADPLAQQAELIITSPMRRTIQTALDTIDWLIEKGVKIQADALWQGTIIARPVVSPPRANIISQKIQQSRAMSAPPFLVSLRSSRALTIQLSTLCGQTRPRQLGDSIITPNRQSWREARRHSRSYMSVPRK